MLFLPLFTSICWSLTPYFFAEAQNRIGVNQLNTDRLLFASIILFFLSLFFASDFNITLLQYFFIALSGLIGLVCGDYFLFTSFRKIGPRYSSVMMSLAPIFTCIGAIFLFDENIGIIGFFGIIITISGIIIVVSRTTSQKKEKQYIKPSKLIFGILGALGQSLGILCVKQAYCFGELSGMSATFFRISASAGMILLWLLLLRKYKNPVIVYKNDKSALKYVLLGTIFGPVLGVTSSIISLEYVPVSIAQTLFSTSPIFMLPISHFIMRDRVNIRAIIGVVVVIIGIGLLTMF